MPAMQASTRSDTGMRLAASAPRPALPAAIAAAGIIAIGRGLSRDRATAIAEVLWESGVHAFEITLQSDEALKIVESLAQRQRPRQTSIGVGTVLSIAAAQQAIDAGAEFLVMPHTDPDLVAWAAERGIPTIPGAMTPTEALTAWRAGASGVKIFPASAVGASFIADLRGPLPDILTIPTGGVTLSDVPGLIEAGATAVGIGSWLTTLDDTEIIRSRAVALLDAVRTGRARRHAAFAS